MLIIWMSHFFVLGYRNSIDILSNQNASLDEEASIEDLKAFVPTETEVAYTVEDEETLEQSDITVYYEAVPDGADEDVNAMSYLDAVEYFEKNGLHYNQKRKRRATK